jgi:hypothetical protein
MFCKYCKSKEHMIDNCPDIICRICKESGHPHWKCNLKKEDKSNRPTVVQLNVSKLDDLVQYMDKPWTELQG